MGNQERFLVAMFHLTTKEGEREEKRTGKAGRSQHCGAEREAVVHNAASHRGSGLSSCCPVSDPVPCQCAWKAMDTGPTTLVPGLSLPQLQLLWQAGKPTNG